jgi:EAL domain-containing protein (putative c-di-GMP-specific phosphodiesterase class I)
VGAAALTFEPVLTMGGRMVAVEARGPGSFEAACADLAAWRQRPGWERLAVTVRLSGHQLSDPSRIDELHRTLEEHGLPPEAFLLRTGYPTLLGLRRPPVAVLELERTLVAELGRGGSVRAVGQENDVARALVASMIGLAHQLKLRVLAVGVERVEQLDVLRELGCDLGQGFYWSAPVRSEEMIGLLDGWVATGLPITAGR